MRTLKGDSVQQMPCGVGPVSHAGSHVPVTKFCFVGATRRDRTGDLLITNFHVISYAIDSAIG